MQNENNRTLLKGLLEMLTTRMLMKCSEQCLVLTHQVLQRQAPTGQIIKCNGWPCFHPQKDTQTCVIHYAPLLSLRLPPVLCRKSRMQCSAVQGQSHSFFTCCLFGLLSVQWEGFLVASWVSGSRAGEGWNQRTGGGHSLSCPLPLVA